MPSTLCKLIYSDDFMAGIAVTKPTESFLHPTRNKPILISRRLNYLTAAETTLSRLCAWHYPNGCIDLQSENDLHRGTRVQNQQSLAILLRSMCIPASPGDLVAKYLSQELMPAIPRYAGQWAGRSADTVGCVYATNRSAKDIPLW